MTSEIYFRWFDFVARRQGFNAVTRGVFQYILGVSLVEGNKNLVLTTDKITGTLAVSKTTATCSLKTLEQFGIIKRARGRISLCEPPKSWLEKTVPIDTVSSTVSSTVGNSVLNSRALGGGKGNIPSPPKGEGIVPLSRDTIPNDTPKPEKTLSSPKMTYQEFLQIIPKEISTQHGYLKIFKLWQKCLTPAQVIEQLSAQVADKSEPNPTSARKFSDSKEGKVFLSIPAEITAKIGYQRAFELCKQGYTKEQILSTIE